MAIFANAAASHLGEVTIELVPGDQRTLTSEELGNRWRELTDPIPEATSVTFQFSMMSVGEDVDVMLVGPNLEQLTLAAEQVKARLGEYAGVFDIADSFQDGKQELQLGIKPRAETLGLSLEDLGRQVRQAFYGEEAQRIQRGRDDIRVMVRYPAEQRRSLGNLEGMWIRTPDGVGVPFRQVADVQPGRGFASIKRVDRNRAINVTASVDAGVTSSGAVLGDLENRILPGVLARYPGVVYVFEGMQSVQQESIGGLTGGVCRGPVRHLRVTGGPTEVVRPAAHHHERDSLRAGWGYLGTYDPRDDVLDDGAGGALGRRRQRQPDHGRLHQPPTAAARGRPNGRA